VTGGDLKHAHVPDLVGFAIQAAVSAPVALVAYRAVLRGRQAEAHAPWPRAAAVRVGFGGWLVGTAFAFGGALVAALVLHEFGYDPKPQDLVRRAVSPNATPGFLAALAVYGSVIAPVVEECVFRGAIFASLRRVRFLGPVGAGVVSAAIFGAVHMDVTAFLPLFGLALVLAWVYERTGSLVAPIAVHMLNNASSLLPIVLLHT
jgi:membrane protease YdiL (CAAX protease family)